MITAEALSALAEVERTKKIALEAAQLRLPAAKAEERLAAYVDAEERLFHALRAVFPEKFEDA